VAVRIIAHGHFYQPPREDPWTGEIDIQPEAAPARDWNERVFQECYGPNTAVRIPTPEGDRVVNNFERLSFNVGPTLMAWLEKEHRNAYLRMIEADRQSLQNLGHGNAIAQAFHHTILPLSSVRDIRTQVRWGLSDFSFRFGRRAEGMWLPETAVNDATLAILIEEGVEFTILAPHQAAAWKADGEDTWHSNVAEPLDTRVAYRFEHPDGSGRSIAVFYYDGELARGIAFENLGSSADRYLAAFAERHSGDDAHVVHAATDGETYGHHHKFSDLGLAFALFVEIDNQELATTNYAAFLADNPPRHEVRLPKEPTSWSCAHGVGRWMDDCGCSTYGPEGWNQKWRGPLRAGLEVIRWAVDETYEKLAAPLFVDPWGARDRYVGVVVGAESLERFVESETAGLTSPEIQERATALLELQRNSMQMFTSCGWFFYDVSRIETVQILRYAARTLDILSGLGLPLPEEAYMPLLDEAGSNDPEEGTAGSILRGLLAAHASN
jgi:alpha-amylase/alpha-mannosidase (GH57 family)